MKGVAKLLLIVAFCPVVVCAQGRRGGGGGIGGRGFGREGRSRYGPVIMDEQTVLDLVTALLNLSDMQRQQVLTIFDTADKNAAPVAAQMESSKDSLFDAVKMGQSDDTIKAIATQQGLLRTQILTIQAQTFARMYALLTNDQKA